MSNPVINNVSRETQYAGFNQPMQRGPAQYGGLDRPGYPAPVQQPVSNGVATLQGLASKLGGLLLVTFIVAGFAIHFIPQLERTGMYVALGASGLIAIICSVLMVKKPQIAGPAAGILAVAEGVLAGAISAVAVQLTGNYQLIWVALAATAGTFLAMYVLFATGLIKATKKFRTVVGAAVLAVGIFYVFAFVLSFFGIEAPLVFSSSGFGIAFTVGVIILAALTLIIDFDDARNIIGSAPKTYEWAVAGGLLVSLVWLYIEFLRLLIKLTADN